MGGRAAILWVAAGVFGSAVFAAGRAAVTSSPAPGPALATTRPPADDPHWKADGCGYCHRIDGGRVLPIPAREVDSICVDCHDGRRARYERHPVGRAFDGRRVVAPAGWPLLEGRIVCVTCHEPIIACRLDRARGRENPYLLRGYEKGLLAFCGRCHLADQFGPHSPHRMLNPTEGTVESACRFCHVRYYNDRDRMHRSGDSGLRTDEVTLCAGCHPEHIDYFEPGHMGAKVRPEMKTYMVSVDRALKPPGSRAESGPAGEAGRLPGEPVRLPLHGGDTVVCSTCHNPHEEGVFPRESDLEFGAVHPDRQRQTRRLRGLGKELCAGCHGR